MSLFKAITTKDVFTENGMPTHSTSSDAVMDLFFKMGGWNEASSDTSILSTFSKAYYSDRLLATKALFYNRDIRGGQGRRNTFHIMFRWLCINDPDVAIKNLHNVPYFGRWDDVLETMGTPVWEWATDFIFSSLKKGDKLCAKWMPRENKSKGSVAKALMKAWGFTPRTYRKLIAGNTDVVETIMCNNEWPAIDYNKIPSVAINKYRTAFYRHDEGRFSSWIESLTKPESGNKIHADAIYPHDIAGKYLGGGAYGNFPQGSLDKTLEAQWAALPNYLPEGRKILPVVDVSGSMGMNGGLPIKVAVSLGIYLSERNEGPFKNGFITFSARPALQYLTGTLFARCGQLVKSQWDMNTDLDRVFRLILGKALEGRIPQSEMPDDILILSDMQFDACVGGMSAMEMIKTQYRAAGYKMPNIIFWNLRTSSGVPAKYDERGVGLVSGFSPSIMKSIMSGEINPTKIMMNVLGNSRYNCVL